MFFGQNFASLSKNWFLTFFNEATPFAS